MSITNSPTTFLPPQPGIRQIMSPQDKTVPIAPDDAWKLMFQHLGRGAKYGYYWQMIDSKRITTWYPTSNIP